METSSTKRIHELFTVWADDCERDDVQPKMLLAEDAGEIRIYVSEMMGRDQVLSVLWKAIRQVR